MHDKATPEGTLQTVFFMGDHSIAYYFFKNSNTVNPLFLLTQSLVLYIEKLTCRVEMPLVSIQEHTGAVLARGRQ